VCQGKPLVLTWAVDSGLPLSFQWRFNGANIMGATNTSLGLTKVEAGQAGIYSVEARNAAGTVQSRGAVVTVKPLLIRVPPQSQNVLIGGEANLRIVTESALPVAYQWLHDGESIPGAAASVLTLRDVQLLQLGAYSVISSNLYGSVVSPDAHLSHARVLAWGDNTYGQTNVPVGTSNIVSVAAFIFNSLALSSDGRILAWGANGLGEAQPPADATNVVAIANGPLALRGDETVVAWGDKSAGLCDIPAGLTNVVGVAAGARNIALMADGTLVSWGRDNFGGADVPLGLSNVVSVSAFGGHGVAVKADSTVTAWGIYWSGSSPIPIHVPEGLSNVVAVASGILHDLALKSDGTVVGWGHNRIGQLDTPPGLSNVVAIAAGQECSMALKADGRVVYWPSGMPVRERAQAAARLSNVVGISGGMMHEIALIGDGSPAITLQPFSQTVSAGSTVLLRTWGVGGEMKHQWRFNAADIPGETNKTLILTGVRLDHAGRYQDVVSNSQGSVTSRVAHVFVKAR